MVSIFCLMRLFLKKCPQTLQESDSVWRAQDLVYGIIKIIARFNGSVERARTSKLVGVYFTLLEVVQTHLQRSWWFICSSLENRGDPSFVVCSPCIMPFTGTEGSLTKREVGSCGRIDGVPPGRIRLTRFLKAQRYRLTDKWGSFNCAKPGFSLVCLCRTSTDISVNPSIIISHANEREANWSTSRGHHVFLCDVFLSLSGTSTDISVLN
jgi:hypothetical protein